MKYLGEGRIQDSKGKVWFFSSIKETVPSFWGDGHPTLENGVDKNVLIAVSEKWATDTNSILAKSRYREWEQIEIPFKQLIVKTEPFERIENIIF